MFRKHLTYANVVATLALIFAMSGGALAAKHYLITSTNQISPKVLKKLTGKGGATGNQGVQGKEGAPGHNGTEGPSGKGEQGPTGKEGALGAQGKEGPTGKEGAQGEEGKEGKEGAAAITLWARVKFDGTLAKGSGVESTEELFPGGYEVVFDQDVSQCAYEATLGSALVSNSESESVLEYGRGEIIVEPREGNADAVFVETLRSIESTEEKPFHLAVFC